MPTSGDDQPTALRHRGMDPARASRFVAGQLVGDRFRIIAPLGRGGMGEVFRAEDTRLGQQVALKFLPPEIAADRRMIDRLIDEVRIGRGVSHPNLCRIYDIGEAPGPLYFIAMEFVDGEDLASLLRRIGRLPADKALAVAHDVCGGLAAAHDAGVIHRDLKPANIMIDGRGNARITDFGLAIASGAGHGGDFAGTPAYMSPQQLAGGAADVRSDIFALGAVFFEIFTGHRLFDARSVEEIKALQALPRTTPSTLLRDIDPGVERMILQCLEQQPERRPLSVRELAEQLPQLPGTVSSRARAVRHDTPLVTPTDQARSIAVLPFDDLSGSDDDYFGAGLAEEIISDLAKIRALRVISRGSVMRYKNRRDLPTVARELQVAYLLTGSVRRAAGQLRVTANLVEGQTDRIVWSEKFKGTVDDVFDIQESVARTVADCLRASVTAEERDKIAQRPIPNVLAFDYYLRARTDIGKFTNEGLTRALEQLHRGLDLIGPNVLIYSAMAYASWQYYNAGLDVDPKHLHRAEELATEIDRLEPDSAHAHRIRGLVAVSRGDVGTGIKELARAMEDDGNDVDALGWLSFLYSFSGLTDLAVPLARRLEQVDPFSLMSFMSRIIIHWIRGEFLEGLALARAGHAAGAESLILDYVQSLFLVLLGKTEDALPLLDACAGRNIDNYFGQLAAFLAAALRGDHAAALGLLDSKLAEPSRSDLQYSVEIANGLAVLGEIGGAVDWLENALSRGFLAHDYVARHDLLLANARADSRFQDLVARMRRECDAFRERLKFGRIGPWARGDHG